VSRKPIANDLGQVYEQFLGKVIRLTAGHQAKVEEEPECPVPAVPCSRDGIRTPFCLDGCWK
jgi:hypothetical protein